MEYNATSIKEVIGRIIRNTGVQDSSFISDMGEWIPEAMGYMKTRHVLQNRYEDVEIHFHAGKLPCGLDHIRSVEYNGGRLPLYNPSRDPSSLSTSELGSRKKILTGYLSVITQTEVTEDMTYRYDSGALQLPLCTESEVVCNRLCEHEGEYYFIELGYIKTSFSSGTVRIHYRSLPVDDQGFPLIPDNEHYKQALYWYVRGMMIGAGFNDRVFSFDFCDQKYKEHAKAAVSEIRYPSTDEIEHVVESTSRLILPDTSVYFQSYFDLGPEKSYGYDNGNYLT